MKDRMAILHLIFHPLLPSPLPMNKTSNGSTGDPEQDMLGREELVESSLPLLFETYDEAVHSGLAEPVVFLLDCEDPLGGEIARAWLGEEAVEDAIAAQAAEAGSAESTTVFARAFSFAESRREIATAFPYLQGTFEEKPPQDVFIAVAISFGGAATFFVPLDAREEREGDRE